MKTKRAKTVYVERGQLTGQGETKTEAKADLDGKIEAALKGPYNIRIVNYGLYSAIVYRQPSGWCYKMLLTENMVKPGIVEVDYTSLYDSEAEAMQAASFHVLDLGGPDEWRKNEDIPLFLMGADKRACVLSNARFRRAYAWAKENKPEGRDNDHLWHEWASWNCRNPEFA